MLTKNSNTEVRVLDVQNAAGGRIISHRVRVESGEIVAKTSVLETKSTKILSEEREPITRPRTCYKAL